MIRKQQWSSSVWHAGGVAALLFAAAWSSPARAIPAFARKYGMSCSACHEAWPKLNDQGIAFRDNGYQWGTGKDAPIKLDPAYWPIAFRTAVGYQVTSTSGQATNSGPVTLQTGRIGYTGGELRMGGTLAHDGAVLAGREPFLTNAGMAPEGTVANPGELGLMESLWVRFDNLFHSPWLNFKIGRGALDLPFDEHRSLTIIDNFDIYHYHPNGGLLPFELGENQFQATIEGHNSGSSTRYSVGLIQTQNDPGEWLALSAPGVYGHVQQSIFPWPDVIPEIRLGLLGMAGSYPTMALYNGALPNGTAPPSGPLVNPDGSPAPVVPNSAYALREFYNGGADASIYFGNLALPLNLECAYIFGADDPSFVTGATREALYHGGFLEADWTPRINLTFVGRYDFIQNLQQGDPSQPSNLLDTQQQTVAIRYTLEYIPRTEVALHVELSHQRVLGGGAGGSDLQGYLAFGGVDFAF